MSSPMASTPDSVNNTMKSADSNSANVVKDSKAEKARRKAAQENEWVKGTTLDDVISSESEWVQVGYNAEQKTRLQSIKGASSKQLNVSTLKKFCIYHRIGGYKDRAKHVISELIVKAAKAKDLDLGKYPANSGNTAQDDSSKSNNKTISNSLSAQQGYGLVITNKEIGFQYQVKKSTAILPYARTASQILKDENMEAELQTLQALYEDNTRTFDWNDALLKDYIHYLIAWVVGANLGIEISPPSHIDLLWHIHLGETKSYRKLEKIIIQKVKQIDASTTVEHIDRSTLKSEGKEGRLNATRSLYLLLGYNFSPGSVSARETGADRLRQEKDAIPIRPHRENPRPSHPNHSGRLLDMDDVDHRFLDSEIGRDLQGLIAIEKDNRVFEQRMAFYEQQQPSDSGPWMQQVTTTSESMHEKETRTTLSAPHNSAGQQQKSEPSSILEDAEQLQLKSERLRLKSRRTAGIRKETSPSQNETERENKKQRISDGSTILYIQSEFNQSTCTAATSESSMNRMSHRGLDYLSLMPGGILHHIFSFTHEEERQISLITAGRLIRSIGFLSKSLHNCCFAYLRETPIDANFYALSSPRLEHLILPGMVWLAKNKVKLGSFALHFAPEDYDAVAYVLRSCDTSSIRHLTLVPNGGSVIHLSKYRGDLCDLTIRNAPRNVLKNCLMVEAGVPKEVVYGSSLTDIDYHQNIAESCQSLESIKIHAVKHVPLSFLRLPLLEELDLTIPATCSDCQYRLLSKAIEQMPNLKSLILGHSKFRGGCRYFQITSTTLRCIDISNCDKGFWVDECKCPCLKVFKCRPGAYGNGIRPITPRVRDGKLDWGAANFQPPEDFSNRPQFSIGSIPCEGMQVPDSCIVEYYD